MSFRQADRKHKIRKVLIDTLEAMNIRSVHAAESPMYAKTCELMVEDLLEFTPEIIEAGLASWRRDWKYRSWPNVADLLPYFRDERAAHRVHDEPKTIARPASSRSPTDWAAVRAKNDRYDRDVLGIKPLGKPASKATKQELRAYWARRENAMKLRGLDKFKKPISYPDKREAAE